VIQTRVAAIIAECECRRNDFGLDMADMCDATLGGQPAPDATALDALTECVMATFTESELLQAFNDSNSLNRTRTVCLAAEGCEFFEECQFVGTEISDEVFSEVETCAGE